jgi:hypothetical protein
LPFNVPEDFVAGLGVTRHRLAGDGGLVDRGSALLDDAVGEDALGGADDDDVAWDEEAASTSTSSPSRRRRARRGSVRRSG